MTDVPTREKVTELIRGIKVAMLTYVDAHGHLVSKPMATQDVEFGGDLWFITERDSEKVGDLDMNPSVNVAYAGSDSWVSVSGAADVVDDRAKLAELWDTFTDAWMEGGPENPNTVLLHVVADTAEYWELPSCGLTSRLYQVVGAKATGESALPYPDIPHDTVDLR